jgi:hypothetical protein
MGRRRNAMYQWEMDREQRFKRIVGLDDLSPLHEAGIHTMADYARTAFNEVGKVTRQPRNEVKQRQLAARIYLRSGLEPDMCLRVVKAGAHNSCEVLSLNVEDLELDQWEERCLQMAKLNVAFENIRRFLRSEGSENKETVMAEMKKLKPKERQAAIKSVEILGSLPQFRWIRRKFNQVGGGDIDPVHLADIVASIPEEEAQSILEDLNNKYKEELC